MKQKDAILNYIATHGEISNGDALVGLNIGRLASRVHELRAAGWNLPIEKEKNATNNGYHGVYKFSALDAERYAGGNK